VMAWAVKARCRGAPIGCEALIPPACTAAADELNADI
jgi:hypothetical protein